MSGRQPRRVVRLPAYEAELRRLRVEVRRADEAFAGLEQVIARVPELGMAVPGHPGWCARPVHTDDGSFLVVYSFDERDVVCRGIRRVPSSTF